jgi:hypothetical protein
LSRAATRSSTSSKAAITETICESIVQATNESSIDQIHGAISTKDPSVSGSSPQHFLRFVPPSFAPVYLPTVVDATPPPHLGGLVEPLSEPALQSRSSSVLTSSESLVSSSKSAPPLPYLSAVQNRNSTFAQLIDDHSSPTLESRGNTRYFESSSSAQDYEDLVPMPFLHRVFIRLSRHLVYSRLLSHLTSHHTILLYVYQSLFL